MRETSGQTFGGTIAFTVKIVGTFKTDTQGMEIDLTTWIYERNRVNFTLTFPTSTSRMR